MTDDERSRAAVLEAWSKEAQPTLLAPTLRSGDIWVNQNAYLMPWMTRKPRIVTPRNAETALRGYSGTLVVVRMGERPQDELGIDRNTEMWDTLSRVLAWGRFSTWTETLP